MLFKWPHTESTIKLDTSRGWATQGPNESTKTVFFRIDHYKTAVKVAISMGPGLKYENEAHFSENVRQTAAKGQTVTRHSERNFTKGGVTGRWSRGQGLKGEVSGGEVSGTRSRRRGLGSEVSGATSRRRGLGSDV